MYQNLLRGKNKLMVVGLLLAIAGSAIAAPAPILLVWGDSLSSGYGLASKKEAWPSLLQQKLIAQNSPLQVINPSVAGMTTAEGATRLPSVLERLGPGQPDIMILALGANDALRNLSLTQSRKNLTTMMALARKRGMHIMLIGIQVPPNLGLNDQLTAMYRNLARSNNIPLLPSLLQGIETRFDLFQSDGIHPTAAAQPLVLDNVWKTLQPLLKKATP